ncbi:MAG: response regulator [Neptuniibacter sp.]
MTKLKQEQHTTHIKSLFVPAVLLSFLVLLLGLCVLAGWYMKEPLLIQVHQSFVPMQYNTALGFALSGAALGTLLFSFFRISSILGITVFLIGSLTLVQYVFGVELSIDQLFMEHYIQVETSHPGRMAPNTAVCFTISGSTILLAAIFNNKNCSSSCVSAFSSAVIGLGIVALLGYFVGVDSAYGWGRLTKMAIHTAVGFILLGGGLLFLSVIRLRAIDEQMRWFQYPVGIGSLTITAALWQALAAQESKLVATFGEAAASYSDEGVLVFGVLFSAVLTLMIGLISEVRRHRDDLEQIVDERTAMLHESQQRFELATIGAGDGLWEYDSSTHTVWFSPVFLDLLGYQEGEIKPSLDAMNQRVHPEDIKHVTEAFTAHIERDIPYDIEYRMRTKNDVYLWFRVRVKTLRNDDGLALKTSGTISEISNRKELEFRLSEERSQFQDILDKTPIGVGITVDGCFVLVNPRLNEMMGVNVGEYSQMKYVHPDERDIVINMLQDGIEVENREIQMYDKHDEVRDMLVTYKLIDFNGEQGNLAWLIDITDRKRIETELNDRVSDLADSRRASLNMMRDLESSRVIAEEATKAKSDFLANMSHEIRTPMNAIIGMSGLALGTELDKKQRNYVEKVNGAAVSLLGIINDILDFSKIEAGKLEIESIEFRLEDVMDNLSSLLSLKAEEKKLELLFDVAADVPTYLIGDPLRLGQMLLNLGNNAIKFTERGEVVVSIEIVRLERERTTLNFSIKDSGIGMSIDQQKNLFQSFSQADTSTTRKYGGSGLGLAISKRLCDLMGGEISVKSELSVGSTFEFTADFGVQVGEPVGRIKPELPELKGLKVLIVDDNSVAREILLELMSSFDFDVTGVSSGEDAIRKASAHDPYDLVVMDWKMPRIDGIDASSQIRNLHPETPIILVTAYSRDDALEAAHLKQLKFDHILNKPVSASTMLDAVMKVFGHEITESERANLKLSRDLDNAKALSGAKVLLVEDNDVNQELALELLANGGILATLAENGQEALNMLANEEFDGVLMDCQMPVMDGYTATRELRKQAKYADLPIIAMTANVMTGDKEKVIDAGMNDHIPKPINVDEMFNTMAKWITPSKPSKLLESVALPVEDNSNEAFPALERIDTKVGLAIAENNTKLYRKLLNKFCDGVNNLSEQLEAAESEDKARLIHTLKGTSGNIGAIDVSKAASELEQVIAAKAEGVVVEHCIGELLVQVEKVKNAIQGLNSIKEVDELPEQSEHDPEKENNLMKQLRMYLEGFDTGALEVLEELETMPLLSFEKGKLKELSNAVGKYDFASALAILNEIQIDV